MAYHYLIALGSNQRHHRHGSPSRVLHAALAALTQAKIKVKRIAPIIASAPVGPSRRRYANGAAVVKCKFAPDDLLARLKAIEMRFGRRRGGQRWAARVLDLDIILWSEGCWASPGLTIPHPAFRERSFVLQPAQSIAPDWRDPLTGRTMRQLDARLTRTRTRRLTTAITPPKRNPR